MSTSIEYRKRFKILFRDHFQCAFCGAEPGNDSLQVDHILPRSRGGSNHNNNLVCTCAGCNNGKSNNVIVPIGLCVGARDRDGWITWKAWGRWELKWNPDHEFDDDPIVLTYPTAYEYWIGISRVHEPDWEGHIQTKEWCSPEDQCDFATAIEFARTLIREDA